MIAKLTPAQLAEFERVVEACDTLPTERERQRRIQAVTDPAVRSLLRLAYEEPVSTRNLSPGMCLGDCELVERLGGGGFGEVWRARRPGAEPSDVAVKVIRNEHLRGEASARLLHLFQEEIERHRALDHPGIVKLLAAGSVVLPGSPIPTPYLIMELCRGLPLHDACRGHSVEEKIQCMIRVCEAVQFAHRHGIMHLDLKPQNILVIDDGGRLRPKLLDFGIARNFRPDRPFDPVRFGAGTLPYKAPEQIEPALGGEDFRTDVHALGTLLFQILTDRLPYPVEEGSAAEYKKFILDGPRLGLDAFDKSIDSKLREICARAMAIARPLRYDSPARLAEALLQWQKQRSAAPRRRWLLAGLTVVAVTAIAAVCLRKTKPEVSWQPFPVNTNGLNLGAHFVWYDVAWDDREGWLCGSMDEQATPGEYVGEGLVLHTSDGGHTWKEMPRTNFPVDSGTFSCFEGKTWNGVGALDFIEVDKVLKADGRCVTNGCVAGMTGVYFTTDAGSDDAQWTRLTPPPDGPDCYSYFSGIREFDKFHEIYAYGWQGIAHWQSGGQWTVELKTCVFSISSLARKDNVNTDVWAVSGGGGADVSKWATAEDHGAIFHFTQSTGRWERVPLPGSAFDSPHQGLSDIIADPEIAYIVAVGAGGLILRGEQFQSNWVWKRIPSNTKQSLNSIAIDPDLNLWIAGNDGVILWSRNGGLSWEERPCFDEHGTRISDGFARVKFFGRQGWIIGGQTLLRCDLP
jgi:serine/threonine protein kinase